MKKTYIKPDTQEAEMIIQMVCLSQPINGTTKDKDDLLSRSLDEWDEGEEE